MDHKIAYELLESYAFGILDEGERAAVEEHLNTGCAECAARLRDVSELSVRLAMTVPQVEAPGRIRERLFERIGMTHHPARSRARERSLTGWLGVAWGTAAVAVAAAVVLMFQTVTLKHELRDMNKQLTANALETQQVRTELADYKDELEKYKGTRLLGEPGTRFVSLNGMDPNPQAFGTVATAPDKSMGMLYVYRFPMAPENKEYQLWGLRDGKPPISLGMFTVDKNGTAMLKMESIPASEEIVGFSVTIEPRGGMPQPTGMMYVKGMDPMEEPAGG